MIPVGLLGGATPRAPVGTLWTPWDLATPPLMVLNDQEPLTGSSVAEEWGISTNGLNMLQSNGSFQPTVTAAGLNGRRIVSFDDSNDVMTRQSSAGCQNIFRNKTHAWAFGVHKKRTLDGVATSCQLLLGYNNSTGTRFGIRTGSTNAANKLQLLARRLDADSTGALEASVATGTSWYMWLAVMDYATGLATIYINGEPDTSQTITSTGATSNTAASGGGVPLTLGNNAGGTTPGDVDLAELVVGDVPLDSDEIDQLFGYAAHHWGLTASLDSGHPYKSAPPYGGGSPPPAPTTEWLWVQAVKL